MSQALTRQDQIKTYLVGAQKQITSLLQDEAKAKKFLAASLVVASDKSLINCDPNSIVQSLVGIAMSDLSVDKNVGHAYLIPYKGQCTLQLGYKGFIQLLFRAGWALKAFPVFKCDKFEMQSDGWDNAVRFSPNLDERNEGDPKWVYENIRGVYVIARHADTKDEYSHFVSKQVIEKLRLASSNQKIGQYTKPEDKAKLDKGLPIGIWEDWYAEMAIAKAVKKLAKVLPIGDSRVQVAIAADDKAEIGGKVDYIQTAEQGVVIESEAVHVEDQPAIEDEQLDQYADDIRETGSMADLESVWNGIPKQYKKLLKATLDDQKLVIEKMGAAA